MKVNKEALRHARHLVQACTKADGTLDLKKAATFVDRLGKEKPRNYLGILTAFQRLLRLEAEQRTAVVTSTKKLDTEMKSGLEKDLKKRYGKDLTIVYEVEPDLIGGMRVKVGCDVWDGSVRARLGRLRQALS